MTSRGEKNREKVWLLTSVCCCRSSNEWLPISFQRFLHLLVWRTERRRLIICRLWIVDSWTSFLPTTLSSVRCVWKHCARNGQPSKMKVRFVTNQPRNERGGYSGAVISGSRMDLSNNESKPARFRSNNSFVLPTSLSNDLSSLHMTPSDSNDELDSTHLQQTSANPMFAHSTASQPIAHHSSAYQAIEAAYREHGIRIHLNPTTATAIGQQHSSASDYLNGSKPPISLQRPRVFIHRTPSRSSSALHYTDAAPDHKQDSRPFSALQQTSNHDFEQYRRDDLSCGAVIDLSQLPARPNVEHSSTSILASERSNLLTPPTNVGITTIVTKPIENDPDLAYMSRLLKTTNGDSFRGNWSRTELEQWMMAARWILDTIRRRAGLRGTFAVHRHAQPPGNQKQSENSAMPHALTAHRSPLFRHSTIAVTPTAPGKKVEKDILKHASRIRTSHSKECFTRLSSPVRSRKANQTPSMSTSPTRTHHRETKRTKVKKSSKSISLVSATDHRNKMIEIRADLTPQWHEPMSNWCIYNKRKAKAKQLPVFIFFSLSLPFPPDEYKPCRRWSTSK